MDNANSLGFNETEWIKLLFLIRDTQEWMEEMERRIIYMIPVEGKKRLFKRSYRLTASALAHILERHYYRIPRHPEASKFTIPVHEIITYIREAGSIPPDAIPGCLDYERIIDAIKPIGFNVNGEITNIFTVITDSGGCIKSAFPGKRYSAYKTDTTQTILAVISGSPKPVSIARRSIQRKLFVPGIVLIPVTGERTSWQKRKRRLKE